MTIEQRLMLRLGIRDEDTKPKDKTTDVESALCELAEMLAAQDDAICELAELVGGADND